MNDPLPISKFAADAADISYQCNRTIRFSIKKDGQLILEEGYTPDNDSYVHVRGIAGILSQCLYGQIGATDQTATATARFTFHVNGADVLGTKQIYSMRLRNPADPSGSKKVMAVATHTAARAGMPMYLTVIGLVPVYLRRSDGSVAAATAIGGDGLVTTADADPAALFPDAWRGGGCIDVGGEMSIDVLPPPCSGDEVAVRFLNRYDMPESVTAAYMEEKPQTQDGAAVAAGMRTRFGVTPTTEYTLRSGQLRHPGQYDTWQDLLTSRRAQILWHGEWLDIIVTKGNYTRTRRRFHMSQAEITFQTANPLLTL